MSTITLKDMQMSSLAIAAQSEDNRALVNNAINDIANLMAMKYPIWAGVAAMTALLEAARRHVEVPDGPSN